MQRICSCVTTVVLGTFDENKLNISAEGPGDNDKSLRCIAVVKGYNRKYACINSVKINRFLRER